jgi:hypothetical protein
MATPRYQPTSPQEIDPRTLTDEQLQQLLANLGSIASGSNAPSAPIQFAEDTSATPNIPLDLSGGDTSGLSDIYDQQLQDQKDQQQLENLIALLQLGDQQAPTQQVNAPEDLLNQIIAADVEVRSPTPMFDPMNPGGLNVGQWMGAMTDPAYRQSKAKARLDAANDLFARLNPAPATPSPIVSSELRDQIMQQLLEKMGIGGSGQEVPPPQVPAVNGVTGPTAAQSVQNTDAQLAADRTAQMIQRLLRQAGKKPTEPVAERPSNEAGNPLDFLHNMQVPNFSGLRPPF